MDVQVEIELRTPDSDRACKLTPEFSQPDPYGQWGSSTDEQGRRTYEEQQTCFGGRANLLIVQLRTTDRGHAQRREKSGAPQTDGDVPPTSMDGET